MKQQGQIAAIFFFTRSNLLGSSVAQQLERTSGQNLQQLAVYISGKWSFFPLKSCDKSGTLWL